MVYLYLFENRPLHADGPKESFFYPQAKTQSQCRRQEFSETKWRLALSLLHSGSLLIMKLADVMRKQNHSRRSLLFRRRGTHIAFTAYLSHEKLIYFEGLVSHTSRRQNGW